MIASVVIPTHNRADKLALTLERLATQDFVEAWEVIVVDNNCEDSTAEVVRASHFPVKTIQERTPGPAAARNAGAFAATGEFLVLIDDDILVEPDFVTSHVRLLRDHPGTWIVGQVLQHPDFLSTPFGRYRNALYPIIDRKLDPFEIAWFASGNASLPRAGLLELGGYNEEFTTAALEDADLVVRADAAGVRLLYAPQIVALHNDWAGTSIRDYCERQRAHCRSAVILHDRFGEKNPRRDVVVRNSPPTLRDGLSVTAKLGKMALTSSRLVRPTFAFVELVERSRPDTRMTALLYKVVISASMFRGVQEGFATTGRPQLEESQLEGAEGTATTQSATTVTRIRRAVEVRVDSITQRMGFRATRHRNPYATHLPVLIGVAGVMKVARVLELGAGRYSSRLFLDRRAYPDLVSLVSIENDAAWADELRGTFEDDRAQLHVIEGAVPLALQALHIDIASFDLVFCDDSTSADERSATIRFVTQRLGPSSVMVVHDYEVGAYRDASASLSHRFVFHALNPYTGVCWTDASISRSQLRRIRRQISRSARSTEPTDVAAWEEVLLSR